MNVTPIAENPEGNKNGKEAADVQHEHYSLDQGKLLGKERVEQDTESEDGPNKECCVPFLGDVVGVVEDRKALDHSASQVSNCAISDLPSEHAKPTNKVAQHLLRASWGELGDPVVLSAAMPINTCAQSAWKGHTLWLEPCLPFPPLKELRRRTRSMCRCKPRSDRLCLR